MLTAVIQGTFQETESTLKGAHSLAEGFEFRLDLMEEKALKHLSKLKQKTHLPTIFTLRSRSQGGKFTGNERERQDLLFSFLALNPTYVDLEFDIDPAFVQKIRQTYPDLLIISSYHDFEQTPEDLNAVLSKMQKFPADVFKIACLAQNSIDALRMLNFIREKRVKEAPISGMCMGSFGMVTRLLAPVVDSLITYAPLTKEGETAPGQVTLSELVNIYHYPHLSPHTHLYALIGDPVDKSIGHLCHNHILHALKQNAVYVKFPLKPQEMSQFFSLMKTLPFHGYSVTMPLKEHVASHLDHVDAEAKQIGAINTLALQDGKWVGYNTDAGGAFDAIERKLKIVGKKIVILGAGGAAKALAFEGIQRGANVIIVNRTEKKAKILAEQVKGRGYAFDAFPQIKEEGYDLLINTTSVGMAPNLAETPLDPVFLIRGAVVFDAIFNPKETKLLSLAKDKGCQVIYGYEMYAEQALRQLEIWLNEPLDREAILKTIEKIYNQSI